MEMMSELITRFFLLRLTPLYPVTDIHVQRKNNELENNTTRIGHFLENRSIS